MSVDSRNAHTYIINGIAYTRVTRILDVIRNEGLEAWKMRLGADEVKRVLEESAALGTRVHAVVESINHEPHAYQCEEEELQPYADSYREWYHANVAETVLTETRVHSDKYRYAGTFDALLRMRDGSLALCDAKTSRTAVSASTRLQLALYLLAARELGEPWADEVSQRRYIWLPSSRPGVVESGVFDDDQADLDAAEAAVRLYRWREAHKNDWKQRRPARATSEGGCDGRSE